MLILGAEYPLGVIDITHVSALCSKQNLIPDFLGARGVIVIVVGNGHGDMSSNPRRD